MTPPGMAEPRRKRLCVVVASDLTIKAFLMGHLEALGRIHDVTVMANTRDFDFLRELASPVRGVQNRIERQLAPLKDTSALLSLASTFRRERYDAVHSITPKAGLLSMIAALVARVPVRIHTFTGQVWATRTGVSRAVLRTLDTALAACATHVCVDSRSQKSFLVSERVVSDTKAIVLAKGSICGVDNHRFCPNPRARSEIRVELGIGPHDLVFLYSWATEKRERAA